MNLFKTKIRGARVQVNLYVFILTFPLRRREHDSQGVVTPIVRVGPFATGVKMQSRGQAGFLALVKRSRGLSGSVNGQDQLSPNQFLLEFLSYRHDFVYTVYLSRLTSQLPAHAHVQTGHPFWNRTPSFIMYGL